MSITTTVENGLVLLPSGLNLPNGTRVEIIIHNDVRQGHITKAVTLPTFNGGGLQPGVDLDNSRALRGFIEETGKLSQLA